MEGEDLISGRIRMRMDFTRQPSERIVFTAPKRCTKKEDGVSEKRVRRATAVTHAIATLKT